jgi:hypothetical protein
LRSNHHEILRTVFTFRKKELYQVCLKGIPFAIDQYICKDNDIDAYCPKLIEADKILPLSLTDPLLAFKYLKAESKSYLIMRICHAQYDGICLPTILQDFQTALSGEPIIKPKKLDMSQFINAIKDCHRQGAVDYWSAFLESSSMTNICLGSTPDRFAKSEKSAQRRASTVSLSSYGFTFATILKTAWAMVLGEMSHDEDIVFGHLVSGRALPVDGIDQVIGPCLNIVPIRLRLQASIIDLLQNVHEQQIAAMPHEHLGFSQILNQCTSWPIQTRFSSIVQHQDLDESVEHISLNGVSCSIKHITCPVNAADAWVMTMPLDDGTTHVAIEYYSDALEPSLAEELVDRLCRVITDIAADPCKDVSELMNPPPYPRIPLKLKVDQSDEHFCSGDRYDNVVRQVWNEVMGEKDDCTRSIDPNTSIFDVCNNMIIGAKFQHLYEKAGVKVDLEDILRKPTFHGHKQILATNYRKPVQ